MQPQLSFELQSSTKPQQKKVHWVVAKDCRKYMPTMKDSSVSLIVTDPPYFIDGMGDEWNNDILARRLRPGGVVGSLPAGMKFDVAQGEKLQSFLQPIAREWIRLIKPGGFVLCFAQNRLVHRTAMAIEMAGFEIRDILAWRYEGQAKAFSQEHFIRKRRISESEKKRLIKKLGGRKTPQLKPQCELIVMAQAPREGTFVDNWDKWETGLIDPHHPLIEPNRFPGTVIPAHKPRQRHGHMTTKPVDLLQHLIRIFSPEGALIFDPFAGSGSAGVAARLENRDFVGIEIDTEMAHKAEQRIETLTV